MEENGSNQEKGRKPERKDKSLRERLNRLYWWLERRIDPGVRSSQYVYAEALSDFLPKDGSWLDVGCGHELLPKWIPQRSQLTTVPKHTVGIDPDIDSLRKNNEIPLLVNGKIESLPFNAETFDLVSANMVVEHLRQPETAMREIYRVLRNSGKFIFHTPNFYYYKIFVASFFPRKLKLSLIRLAEGRSEEDVFPTHYKMNTVEAIEQIAEECGFQIASFNSVNTSSTGDMVLGPFVIVDLFIRRLLGLSYFRTLRSNFIVVLQKSESRISQK